jgi:hypothetical protein
MPHIEAKPDYRALALGASIAVLILIVTATADHHLTRHLFGRNTLAWHVVLISVFVLVAVATLRLVLNLGFRDIALQIDDDGVYVEGVTRHPVSWATITSVTEGRRMIVFRTTDDDALIHFALFRPSFGRLGWRNWRDVIINHGLLDVPHDEVHSAIQSGMTRFRQLATDQ